MPPARARQPPRAPASSRHRRRSGPARRASRWSPRSCCPTARTRSARPQPLDAAERAATLGVPIYTIALGTPDGQVDVQDNFGQTVTLDVPPDTETLKQIADHDGAKAFDAPTAEELQASTTTSSRGSATPSSARK